MPVGSLRSLPTTYFTFTTCLNLYPTHSLRPCHFRLWPPEITRHQSTDKGPALSAPTSIFLFLYLRKILARLQKQPTSDEEKGSERPQGQSAQTPRALPSSFTYRLAERATAAVHFAAFPPRLRRVDPNCSITDYYTLLLHHHLLYFRNSESDGRKESSAVIALGRAQSSIHWKRRDELSAVL